MTDQQPTRPTKPNPSPTFGDPDSVRRMYASRRAYLSDPLLVVAAKERERQGIRTDEEAWQRMVAPTVPAVVSRRRRARRARIDTIAPSNYSGGFRVVYQGLDALVVNVKGAVLPDLLVLLAWAQEDAKATEEDVESPLPPFLGEPLRLGQFGAKTFRFIARNADVTVRIRKADHAPNMAAAQVELSSACLHRLGWRAAIDALRAWLPEWAPLSVYQPSEVDLCADTQGWQPQYQDFQRRAFVCPVSRPHLIPYEEGHIGYVRYGTGGTSRSGQAPVQCVIYDKTEEIRVSDKGWFVPLWSQNAAYIPEETVTRIEYRFRREWLKERGIGLLSELVDRLDALWREGLEWCRYCIPPHPTEPDLPSLDSNRSRWEARPEWVALARLDWMGGDPSPLGRIDQARPKLERTLAALGGYLVSTQALFSHVMDPDPDAIGRLAVGACKRRWQERGESFADKVQRRALRFGGMAMGPDAYAAPA